ncbi:hypothetical protein [Candidatus Aciduliprofundum boonei]|uniref:DUF3137 domain-containing protein n=1 Tax=Aciduliprofundum boonei (strain DSM 19572 / T469) TaxID=439481 RepID=B5IHG6_ACIB4|nr:hypothetical protein [Candidatus Aciduliprofundum boonei]ADD08826.1 hypothetical protein Aboo_1017 [Aciduliprofundum boonei T469]EDY34283.1 hypothetical protein ABOONEI_2495 [Aciduliprofundum boonei T469]HII55401.1 hypothetical protein [Candidatus Aciduliprofundum boonei]
MSRATKAALIISIFLAIFAGVVATHEGAPASDTLCISTYMLVIGFAFFWFAFKFADAMWKGEKKVWRWLNDEPEPKKTKALPAKSEDEMMLYESDREHRTYFWKDYVITVGTGHYFMMSNMEIPYNGVFIVKEKDFTMFKRVDDINLFEDEIKMIAENCIDKGDCDIILSWKGSSEFACAKEGYFIYSYGIDYAGFLFNNAGFIHLFDHDCRGLTKNKDAMFRFVKDNLNKNEVALILTLPAYTILSLSAKVAHSMLRIDRDIFEVMFPEEKLSYIYDVPFKIRNKKELATIANEAQRLHAEVGVVFEFENKMIIAAKAELARFMMPESKESDLREDILAIYYEGDENPVVVPVEWRAWTKHELIKAASEVVGSM